MLTEDPDGARYHGHLEIRCPETAACKSVGDVDFYAVSDHGNVVIRGARLLEVARSTSFGELGGPRHLSPSGARVVTDRASGHVEVRIRVTPRHPLMRESSNPGHSASMWTVSGLQTKSASWDFHSAYGSQSRALMH